MIGNMGFSVTLNSTPKYNQNSFWAVSIPYTSYRLDIGQVKGYIGFYGLLLVICSRLGLIAGFAPTSVPHCMFQG